MSNIDRLRARLSPERRQKIGAQAAVIIAEEKAAKRQSGTGNRGKGNQRAAQKLLDRRASKAKPRDLLKFLRKAGSEEPSAADKR